MTEKKKVNDAEKLSLKRINVILDEKQRKSIRLASIEMEKATRKYELLKSSFENFSSINHKHIVEFVEAVVVAYADVTNLQRRLFRDFVVNRSEIIAAGNVADITISILPISPWIVAFVEVVPGTEKKEESTTDNEKA